MNLFLNKDEKAQAALATLETIEADHASLTEELRLADLEVGRLDFEKTNGEMVDEALSEARRRLKSLRELVSSKASSRKWAEDYYRKAIEAANKAKKAGVDKLCRDVLNDKIGPASKEIDRCIEDIAVHWKTIIEGVHFLSDNLKDKDCPVTSSSLSPDALGSALREYLGKQGLPGSKRGITPDSQILKFSEKAADGIGWAMRFCQEKSV
ncbi:MAG: hypothetical protein SGJ18_15085 [Pseudomonadota bacterium]|nr:hypothetical protein [Pseudomonadota bacterium]